LLLPSGAVAEFRFADNLVVLHWGQRRHLRDRELCSIATFARSRSIVQNEICGVGAFDPLVLGGCALVLALAALIACALPARRAMQVDPAIVLSEQ
jgi:hypothetical protein